MEKLSLKEKEIKVTNYIILTFKVKKNKSIIYYRIQHQKNLLDSYTDPYSHQRNQHSLEQYQKGF